MRGINHWDDFGWTTLVRMGGGGGGGTTTSNTVQKADPWAGQQPYLLDVMQRAQNTYQNQTPQYYPGNTYSPLNSGQTGAMDALYWAGMQGSPVLNDAMAANRTMMQPGYTSATQGSFDQSNPMIGALGGGAALMGTAPAFMQGQGYLSDAIGGKYLDPSTDPGFQSVVNTTLAKTMPAITAGFTNSGRSDSGLATRAASEGANDAIGGLMMQNYLAERGLQSQAAQQAAQNQATGLTATLGAGGLASNNLLTQQGNQIKNISLGPALDQAKLGDLSTALQTAGVAQQDQQAYLTDLVNRWNYNQALPWNQLGMYNQMVQGNYGSSSQTQSQQPYFSNTGANIMAGVGAAGTVATAAAAIATAI